MRCSMSWASRPADCQTMLTTGMLMDGNMSVGVRLSTNGVRNNSTSDANTKLWALRRSNRTIHITLPVLAHPAWPEQYKIVLDASRAGWIQSQKPGFSCPYCIRPVFQGRATSRQAMRVRSRTMSVPPARANGAQDRSEEHTSELQSLRHL